MGLQIMGGGQCSKASDKFVTNNQNHMIYVSKDLYKRLADYFNTKCFCSFSNFPARRGVQFFGDMLQAGFICNSFATMVAII